jgi:hypothetical protein
VRVPAAGWLRLDDAFVPGLVATVDGRSVRPLADVFGLVVLPMDGPGERHVVLVNGNEAGDWRDEAKKLGQTLGKEKDVDWALNEAAALEQTIDLIKTSEEVIAALRKGKPGNEGPSVTYHLKHKLKPHGLTIRGTAHYGRMMVRV